LKSKTERNTGKRESLRPARGEQTSQVGRDVHHRKKTYLENAKNVLEGGSGKSGRERAEGRRKCRWEKKASGRKLGRRREPQSRIRGRGGGAETGVEGLLPENILRRKKGESYWGRRDLRSICVP